MTYIHNNFPIFVDASWRRDIQA